MSETPWSRPFARSKLKRQPPMMSRLKKTARSCLTTRPFWKRPTTRPDCFYDASALPHPKETIIAALEREIVRSTFEEDVDWLRRSGAFMWNFLEGCWSQSATVPGRRHFATPARSRVGRTPRRVETNNRQSRISARRREVCELPGDRGGGKQGSRGAGRGSNCHSESDARRLDAWERTLQSRS